MFPFFFLLIFVLLYWGVNLYRKHLQESLRKAALIINWIGVQCKSIELIFLQILMLKTYTSRSFFQMVEKQEQKNIFFKLFKRKSLLKCHCSSGYIPENHLVDVASLLLKYLCGWQTSLFPTLCCWDDKDHYAWLCVFSGAFLWVHFLVWTSN